VTVLPSPTLIPRSTLLPGASLGPVSPEVFPDLVMDAVESLMEARRREGGFSSAGGGRIVPHFTSKTAPALSTVEEVTTRHAATVASEYPDALDRAPEVATTVAALNSAIELELGQIEPNVDLVRLWRDLLAEEESDLSGVLSPAAEGGRALAPVWSFRTTGPRAEGSEEPLEASYPRRRLRW
jgi:hypothetical protein